MSEDAKKIAALELALKAKTEQLSALHKQMDAAREAIASLESERAANAILTAEIAGLQASAGHLGALVDMQRSILVDVERVLVSDSFGLPLEDGDSKIMDRVRSMLSATTEQQRQDCETVHQWRKAGSGCPEWHDGRPDPTDGGGPYETRTLYAAPPKRDPLSDEQLWSNDEIMSLNADLGWHMDTIRMFARAIERAHGIGGQS